MRNLEEPRIESLNDELNRLWQSSRALTRSEILKACETFFSELSGAEILALAKPQDFHVTLERDNLLTVEVPYSDQSMIGYTQKIYIFLGVQTHPSQKCIPKLSEKGEALLKLVHDLSDKLNASISTLINQLEATIKLDQTFLSQDHLSDAVERLKKQKTRVENFTAENIILVYKRDISGSFNFDHTVSRIQKGHDHIVRALKNIIAPTGKSSLTSSIPPYAKNQVISSSPTIETSPEKS